MDISLILGASLILMIILFFFRTNHTKSGNPTEETERLKAVNEELAISNAKAEERAENYRTESESLKIELAVERGKLSDAMQSLESSRSYFKAQQERLDEQKEEIKNNQEKFNKDFYLQVIKPDNSVSLEAATF